MLYNTESGYFESSTNGFVGEKITQRFSEKPLLHAVLSSCRPSLTVFYPVDRYFYATTTAFNLSDASVHILHKLHFIKMSYHNSPTAVHQPKSKIDISPV